MLTAFEQRYKDDEWYDKYTSRVSDHCTAIFDCDAWVEAKDLVVSGQFIKQQLLNIDAKNK